MNEQLKIIISAEISKFKQNVEKAKSQMDSFKQQVEKASKNVDESFQKMGDGIAKGAKAMAVGIAATGTAILALGASTAEYRAEQARLISAFEAVGGSAETAKQTYNDLYRVLGDSGTATEAAQQLANITTNEKQLAEYTTICQGVYAKWGTAIDSAGLAEGINHTIELGEVQGTLADALEFSGISVEDFNKQLEACNSEAEREKLVRETLTGLYGEAAAIYEENNAAVLAQNEAQAKLQETMAAVGAAVAPIITAFTSFASEALAVVTPYIQQLAETYAPVLNEALAAMGEIIGTVMSALVDNWGIVLTVAGVITGIATAIGIYNAVAAVKAAMAAAEVTTIWGLVAAYTAQAAAMIVAIAPYLLIVAAIAAVIAIIVLCVKHWDEIKAAIANAWEAIKEATEAAVEAVVQWFKDLKEKISTVITNIKTTVSNIFNSIKTAISNAIQSAKDICLSIFDGIKEGIQNRIEAAKNIIQNIINVIKGIFTGDFGAAKQAVLNIFDSIKTGIKSRIESAKNTVKAIIDAIKGFFNFKITWPKIPMPKFVIKPSGWKIGDLLKGSIPKLSIGWNAKGGVFDKPTLFDYGGSLQGIGEAGAEAVVPLENNTKWLDRIATMLSEKMGGSAPIYLQVDGKTFAEISVDSINALTKQRGSLPLMLV